MRQKMISKNLVKKYNISHLSAGDAKVANVSSYTVDEFSITPKKIKSSNHEIIDSIGNKAEITDYAILMGAYYYGEDNKRYGYYWTSTPVESEYFLYNGSGVSKVEYYEAHESKTDYTFYGYSKGNKIDHLKEPCIIEVTDENGTTLYINQDEELWSLIEEEKYFAETTMGACMSGPRIHETIKTFVKNEYVGFTYDFIKKMYKEIRRNEFYSDVQDEKYQYVAGGEFSIRNINDTSVGIRPVFNTYNCSSINSEVINGVKYSYITDFPQTVASKEEQKVLNKLFKKNSLKTTGRVFPTSDGSLVSEFEYNGCKYVRVNANFNDKNNKTLLSNGCEYKNGDSVWVKVEPVELVTTKDNYLSIVNKILFAGLNYKNTLITNPYTSLRCSDFIHFLLINISDYLFTNERNSNDRIVCGTDWMRSYQNVKDKYALYFNIPFEDTEFDAAERYKKEYERLVDECRRQKESMQFDSFDPNAVFKRIDYVYRPSSEFLNSIEEPIIARLAALGPRSVWNEEFYKEYLKAYGLWALLSLQKENIIKISDQMYSNELEKSLKLK